MAEDQYRRTTGAAPPVTSSARLISPDAPQRRRRALADTPAPRARPTGPGPVRGRPPNRQRWRLLGVGAAAVGLFLLGVVGYLVLVGDRSDGGGESTPTASTSADPGTATIGTEGQAPSSGEGAGEGQTGAPAGPAAGPVPPYVTAAFDGRELVLGGAVGDEALVDQLGQAAQLIYAPFVRTELQVDPQLGTPEWMAAAPAAIGLLQTISNGTLTLSEGAITVEGQAASSDDVADLERYLGGTGLPVTIGDIEITGLREAVYVIAGTDGKVALSGALPTEEIRAGLAAAAVGVFGEDNVFDASTVDPTVATALWMYSPEALIATVSTFPSFEVRLDGGDFGASLSGGSVFGPDSAEISPQFAQVLNFGVVVLSRDPSMTITIEGHTDSEGSDDYNLQLSQTRADAVAAYFAAAGIDPARITAVGRGEASPAAPNDTAEGRARNRRVEFSLQSAG